MGSKNRKIKKQMIWNFHQKSTFLGCFQKTHFDGFKRRKGSEITKIQSFSLFSGIFGKIISQNMICNSSGFLFRQKNFLILEFFMMYPPRFLLDQRTAESLSTNVEHILTFSARIWLILATQKWLPSYPNNFHKIVVRCWQSHH